MRTVYYPKWRKLPSPSKQSEVYFPKELHLRRGRKQNQTLVVMRKIDLNTLPANIFTKAWLEGQSR